MNTNDAQCTKELYGFANGLQTNTGRVYPPIPLDTQGYVLSGKVSSRFVIGGALGEMLVPAFIALLLGPNTDGDDDDGNNSKQSGRSAALYDVCLSVSVLLVAVYGTWFGLLTQAAKASPYSRATALLSKN